MGELSDPRIAACPPVCTVAVVVGAVSGAIWERLVKKGRHRRFEEARSLKRAVEVTVEPCPECGAAPEEEHASWCLYEAEELDDVDRYGDGPPGDEQAAASLRSPVEGRTDS
jgi:hypothetical protein